jgi:hypothetical protein
MRVLRDDSDAPHALAAPVMDDGWVPGKNNTKRQISADIRDVN